MSTMLQKSHLDEIVDLPVIDISQFSQELDCPQNQELVARVREACTEWGFFRLVNHGIPIHLLQNVESVVRQLLSMPVEIKQRVATSNPINSYFNSPTRESFCIMNLTHSDSVQEMSDKIWPPGKESSKFCETIRTYTFSLTDLAQKISKIIIASMGLDVKTFYHSDFEKCIAYMRINHYYEGNGRISMEEEAMFSHTDPGCFTILNQDNEGGLQIRSKEGKWLNVRPLPHSFVVNIADSLKAWSNRRYLSAEHRVVYSGWRNRISVAFAVQFPDDKEIWAPAELVDEDHPRFYRPFTFPQFRDEFIKSSGNKCTFLDRYAGV